MKPAWTIWFSARFCFVLVLFAQTHPSLGWRVIGGEAGFIQMTLDLRHELGPMSIDKMALGQGGLSAEPMWEARIPEVRALHPRVIRLFVQEYYDLMPRAGKYHFQTLDRAVDAIVATGASPLLSLCFKPKPLFPRIDQDLVEPNNYADWDNLITRLVKHYRVRGTPIRYWEVANEPDLGEDGGCPFRFQPDSYLRFYEHTARAVLKGDPTAQVGGPALASCRSAILPTLLKACSARSIPLDFVSWHIYSSDPSAIRDTVTYVRGLLAGYPQLKVQTFLDEWNMDLTNPPLDPRFQPCFILETVWNMKEAGLDYSCYYHIRDYYVDPQVFGRFMSETGVAFMSRWWNRMPQFDGLFDYQNRVRPAYFAFKLLSRLGGERLDLSTPEGLVRGFATRDAQYRMENLLIWNFDRRPVSVQVELRGLSGTRRFRHIVLDSLANSDDENLRLRPDPFQQLKPESPRLRAEIEAYGVHYWSLE